MQAQREPLTSEFTYSLPMENSEFEPKSQLVQAKSPTICIKTHFSINYYVKPY